MKNIYWKEFGLLTFVWLAFLAIQITKVRIVIENYKLKWS